MTFHNYIILASIKSNTFLFILYAMITPSVSIGFSPIKAKSLPAVYNIIYSRLAILIIGVD